MATDPRHEHNPNPGQEHSDDMFRNLADRPTSADHPQTELRDNLANAESQAAAGAAAHGRADTARESEPNYYYKPRLGESRAKAKEYIKGAKVKARQNKTSKRGLLIGLGSGGGLLAVVFGFSSLLPFKLPGIMDTIINDSGKRVEHIIEMRAERILFQYILRGSTIALNNGQVIATGNPIGDLFANMRTSTFERDLRRATGLEFKPGPNKTVKLVHNGVDLGNVKSTEQILQILADGEQGKSLTRADLRKIVRTQIPAWRFWKRAKFVNWLRIKYNIPRWGAREQAEGESDADHEKALKKEHIQQIHSASVQNVTDFLDCGAEADECLDKTDQGDKMLEQINKTAAEATDELAEEGAQKATSTVAKLMSTKLTVLIGGSLVAGVGWIDIGARFVHQLGEIVDNDLLQKLHAKFLKNSSGMLGATYAGYSDQAKAGDLSNSGVAMFSNNLDGWEVSATYGIIQASALGGPVVGTTLEPMERANETIDLPTFVEFGKTIFGTAGWVFRGPLELWYLTVSKVFDGVGGVVADAAGWVIAHTPAQTLMDQLLPHLAELIAGFMKFVGLAVDPLEVGDRLALFIHQGFLASFNDKAKEDGMRKLSEGQALEMDNQVRIEERQYMATLSPFERLFSLDNPDSLATRIATTTPSSITTNPIGTLASGSARLVAAAPQTLARVTAGTVYANAPQTSESLFGLNKYGALSTDLSVELDTSVMDNNKQCPENDDNRFNHCKIDKAVVESMKCVFVKCADMYPQNADAANDPLFAYGAEGPLYGPDAVNLPAPRYAFNAHEWVTNSASVLAGLLPITALELSRRRL